MLWYTEFTNRRKHTVSVWFWQTLLWICDSHHSNSLFLWNSRNEDVNDSRSFQLHINNYHDNNCIWQVKFTRNWLYVHLQEFFKKWYPIKSSLMGQFSFRCSLTGKEFTEEVLTSEAYARLRHSQSTWNSLAVSFQKNAHPSPRCQTASALGTSSVQAAIIEIS